MRLCLPWPARSRRCKPSQISIASDHADLLALPAGGSSAARSRPERTKRRLAEPRCVNVGGAGNIARRRARRPLHRSTRPVHMHGPAPATICRVSSERARSPDDFRRAEDDQVVAWLKARGGTRRCGAGRWLLVGAGGGYRRSCSCHVAVGVLHGATSISSSSLQAAAGLRQVRGRGRIKAFASLSAAAHSRCRLSMRAACLGCTFAGVGFFAPKVRSRLPG